MKLLVSLSRDVAVLLAAVGTGALVAAPWVPGGGRARLGTPERVAWGVAVGLALVAGSVPLALAVGTRPGWIPFLALAAAAVAAASRRPAAEPIVPEDCRSEVVGRATAATLVSLIALGVALFALGALAEPMWSSDFLAIWGLKGKTIFALSAVPERLHTDPAIAFSHPEYPLGIPFLYAGLASLAGTWDDHAAAIIFPVFQGATLLALAGWLHRRCVPRRVVLSAAAVLAFDLPLYTASGVGLADIPLSFFALLLGASLSDAVDRTDRGALGRLALASALAVGTKDEGLFLAASALVIGVAATPASQRYRRRDVALAIGLPALALLGSHRLWSGPVTLRDFDFGLLAPARWGELGVRIAETSGHEALHVLLPSLVSTAALAALFALGQRTPWADRLLLLAACAAVAYLALPALGVIPGHPERGPLFLVRTAVGRTLSALGPLVAAGIAGRLGALSAGMASGAAVNPANTGHVL
jgi:hypothetical protein